ncbi:MAG TPA: hypothetical protein PKA21_12445 [Kiritimatiellia bacterium]|nr:hypothetical protein [Kiritimatiellia bacterium]
MLSAKLEAGITYFSFDSAPLEMVGQSRTDYYVSPDTDWSFSVSRNFANGITVDIRSNDPEAPWTNYYWRLSFAAPLAEPLTPGIYENATRYPFQETAEPGLAVSGNHRGYSRVSGFFEIFEVVYGLSGEVLSFSADFTQYGDKSPDAWLVGEIRYNATMIPEPTSVLLVLCGVCAAFMYRHRFGSTYR